MAFEFSQPVFVGAACRPRGMTSGWPISDKANVSCTASRTTNLGGGFLKAVSKRALPGRSDRPAQPDHQKPRPEIQASPVKELARRGRVTLLCHCDEDQRRCHRHLLRSLILTNRV